MVTPECPPLISHQNEREPTIIDNDTHVFALHSHNSHISILGLRPLDRAQKGRSPNHIQSSHTKQPLGVKHTVLLQDLGENGDGRVDRVGDDEDHGGGGVFGRGFGEVSDDRGVGVLPSHEDSEMG
jgi:hypothetical protein